MAWSWRRNTAAGAGQYFTPRPIIDAIMACLAPQPGETMIDPACGTSGFLIAMVLHIVNTFTAMTREQRDHLRHEALHGVDIVQSVIRLCAMNLLLHNVGPTAAQLDAKRRELLQGGLTPDRVDEQLDDLLPVRTDDALRELGTDRYDIVATNPPFGRKSSIKVIGEEGKVSSDAITVERDDFWATTSNKQLNFVQHIKSLLKINGRAGSAQAATQRLWVYDLRTNKHFTLKTRPLQPADLEEFVGLYKPGAIAERQPTWN